MICMGRDSYAWCRRRCTWLARIGTEMSAVHWLCVCGKRMCNQGHLLLYRTYLRALKCIFLGCTRLAITSIVLLLSLSPFFLVILRSHTRIPIPTPTPTHRKILNKELRINDTQQLIEYASVIFGFSSKVYTHTYKSSSQSQLSKPPPRKTSLSKVNRRRKRQSNANERGVP